MYSDFFGFRELPFNNTPDPRFFFSTPDHEEALASLIYAVKERKGFVLLTGDVGTGKTLVTRLMLRRFGTQIAFATLNHAVPDARELMESICTEFEIPVEPDATATQLVRSLHDFLLMQFAQNMPVVLVLDEAQNLSIEGFEQLRMIGNLEADDAKLLQIVIVGQTELQRTFLSPQLRQLRQRVFRSYHLPAMNRETTEGYIRHRLSVSGHETSDIFTAAAISAIYDHSRGLPRLVNTLCDNALLSAYSSDRKTVDADLIASVIEQMLALPHAGACGDVPAGTLRDTTFAPDRVDTATVSKDAAQASRASSETAQAFRQVNDLTHRLAFIEQRIGTQPASAGAGGPTLRGHIPVGDDIRHELASVKQAVRDYASRLSRRFVALEGRAQQPGATNPQTAAACAALKPMLEEARLAVLRSETLSRDLQRREQQLRKLANTVRAVTRDLQHQLDRGHELSAMNIGAHRDAQAVHDRLVAQSKRGRQLADELVALVNKTVARDARREGTARLLKTATADVSTVRPSPTEPVPNELDPTRVQSLIHRAQTSLSDLRDLAREKRGGDDPDGEPAAITRLAGQVDNLLEVVESNSTAATSDERSVENAQTSPGTVG